MNKTTGIILAVVIVIIGIILISRAPSSRERNAGVETSTSGNGRVIYSVTDAAADMGNVSEINMTISEVSTHSDASGWTTVSSTPHTYSLLDLRAKNESKLLADAKMKSGTYDQVRLKVDSIVVKTKDGVSHNAKMPSGELKLNTMLTVNDGSTSSMNFDFLADKSLHTTGNGEYIFAPVVKTEAKSSADVAIDAESKVTISGGHVDNTNTAGMDIDGSVKANFEINKNQKLNVDSNNAIKVDLK